VIGRAPRRRRAVHSLIVAALIVAPGVVGLLAVGAGAETTGRDGVVVSLEGSIQPQRLPRHRPMPVSITLTGSVRAVGGATPPQLTRLEIAFGARGGLDTVGLPRCPRARLLNATWSQALERCRSALVGSGTIDAEVPLNPEEPVFAHARILAFNGRSGGREAVWVHAYSASPPVSFTLPFYIRKVDDGAYGLLMRAPTAAALGSWPRLRSFQIKLGRRYLAHGVHHSYLSASCPLPPRFRFFSFPFARATYTFAPRPTLSTTHLARCSVRG
jgi:hypothetical protein